MGSQNASKNRSQLTIIWQFIEAKAKTIFKSKFGSRWSLILASVALNAGTFCREIEKDAWICSTNTILNYMVWWVLHFKRWCFQHYRTIMYQQYLCSRGELIGPVVYDHSLNVETYVEMLNHQFFYTRITIKC